MSLQAVTSLQLLSSLWAFVDASRNWHWKCHYSSLQIQWAMPTSIKQKMYLHRTRAQPCQAGCCCSLHQGAFPVVLHMHGLLRGRPRLAAAPAGQSAAHR